jgi:predicted O-methyltransferase YrrM
VTQQAGMFDAQVARWYSQYREKDQHRQHDMFRQAVLDRPGAVVVELGAVPGLSTTMFLSALDETGGGELWSVDLDVPETVALWGDLPQWHFLQADDISPQAQAWLPDVCDVLFIDSAHTYAHTLAELRAYAPRVRKGGTALLHDTQWGPGNTDLGEPVGGVAKALDTYCAEAGLEWVNTPGNFGLGTIRF